MFLMTYKRLTTATRVRGVGGSGLVSDQDRPTWSRVAKIRSAPAARRQALVMVFLLEAPGHRDRPIRLGVRRRSVTLTRGGGQETARRARDASDAVQLAVLPPQGLHQ